MSIRIKPLFRRSQHPHHFANDVDVDQYEQEGNGENEDDIVGYKLIHSLISVVKRSHININQSTPPNASYKSLHQILNTHNTPDIQSSGAVDGVRESLNSDQCSDKSCSNEGYHRLDKVDSNEVNEKKSNQLMNTSNSDNVTQADLYETTYLSRLLVNHTNSILFKKRKSGAFMLHHNLPNNDIDNNSNNSSVENDNSDDKGYGLAPCVCPLASRSRVHIYLPKWVLGRISSNLVNDDFVQSLFHNSPQTPATPSSKSSLSSPSSKNDVLISAIPGSTASASQFQWNTFDLRQDKIQFQDIYLSFKNLNHFASEVRMQLLVHQDIETASKISTTSTNAQESPFERYISQGDVKIERYFASKTR
jgi:hypothetical protein